jgi:hypothetical protein
LSTPRHAKSGAEAFQVHRLRVRSVSDTELDWFFNLAEIETGAPSNFGRLLSSVADDGHRRTPDDQAEALRSYRRILGWLRAMPDSDAGVLQAAYEPHDWPRAVRARFGRLTGIAVRLTCSLDTWPEDKRDQEVMEMARARELDTKCAAEKGSAKFLATLQEQAEARLSTALRAYLAVRDGGPCIVGGT